MGYVIVRIGPESEPEYREYLLVVSRRLWNQKVNFDQVPRVPSDYDPSRWRYVHESEEAANADLVVLKEDSGEEGWEVVPFAGSPSVGPLQPLRLDLGRTSSSIGFGLETFAVLALQQHYPDAPRYEEIWTERHRESPPVTQKEIRDLAVQLLPVLTGLTVEQLSIYGGFEVVDPVKHLAVVPSTLLGQAQPEAQPEAGATPLGTAASPARYTESKAG